MTCYDANVALYRLTEEYFGVDMSSFEKKIYSELVASEFRVYDKNTLYMEDGEVITSSCAFIEGSTPSGEFNVTAFGEILAGYFDRLEDLERR